MRFISPSRPSDAGKAAALGIVLLVAVLLAGAAEAGGPPRKLPPRGDPATQEKQWQELWSCVRTLSGVLDTTSPLSRLGGVVTGRTLKDAPPQPLDAEALFWPDARRRAAAIAAQLTFAPDPFTRVAVGLRGRDLVVWFEAPPDVAPNLRSDWLGMVKDDQDFKNLSRLLPEELAKEGEYCAYCQALVFAFEMPREAFRKSADENAHLRWDQLQQQPKLHRGKVVRFEGTLRQLRQEVAPLRAADAGVKTVYTGLVLLDAPGSVPVLVIMPDLPEGLQVSEKLQQRVIIEGYFFKRHPYKQADGKPGLALMVIGPPVQLRSAPIAQQRSETFLAAPIVMVLVGFVAATCVVVLLLGWWFRRSDKRVRKRLEEVQAKRFLDALEEPPAPDDNVRSQ
jgi:hypothetical protein